ncbi:hypothetical protein GTA08_BOTSDO11985 [Neofusicoccum parvum]|nr:hypothetical protein GTA08_BOTSDO11985 [Neofusicoccum parvum]
MAVSIAMPWTDGERTMQDLLRVPPDDNPTSSFLTPQAAAMLTRAPLLALGAVDADGRPWATVWGGETGFSQPLGNSIIGIRSPVDRRFDPVVQALVDGKVDGEVVKEEGRGRMVAGLPIDLVTRKRVKIYGRMMVASLAKLGEVQEGEGEKKDGGDDAVGQMQVVMNVEQSLGNCPKYLNSRKITPATAQPELISDSPILSSEARALIAKADLFFISSTNSTHDMDVNHRGGPTGFVRILPSDSPSSPTTLVYPEYSGNRYYSTVGNMHTTPLAGLCIPDFTTGTVLYATGTTTIQVGAAASALLPRSNLTISITLTSARLVRHGLSFRGSPAPGVGSAAAELVSPTTIGMSPYNPPVRLLAAEGNLLSSVTAAGPSLTATLTRKTLLTPDVARLTFTLSTPTAVQPGQWVALDASGELSIGYSHMRNDDPTSLNDDFIRTFTVTGASAWGGNAATPLPPSAAFDVTVRRHGPVTALLLAASDRAGLELAVRGFGGEFRVPLEESPEDAVVPFVAGGVGITPLLAELAHGLDAARVALFWTLRAGDAALVREVLGAYPGLAGRARVFVTGVKEGEGKDVVEGLQGVGAVVECRRLGRGDLVDGGVESARWYLCAGTPLRKQVVGWLEGKGEVLFEDFNF